MNALQVQIAIGGREPVGMRPGAEGLKDIEKFGHKKLAWLRKFRRFEQGIPVDDTIARIVRALEPEKMAQCFINWINAVRHQQGHQLITIDGKTLRHSYNTEPRDALHAITVWLREQSFIFSQSESAGKKTVSGCSGHCYPAYRLGGESAFTSFNPRPLCAGIAKDSGTTGAGGAEAA